MQPHSVYPTWTVEADINFVAHEKGLQTRPITLKSEGVEANEKGRKWVRKGAFIDKDGKVTKPTVTTDSVTFEQEPVGILFHSVDVTYGDAHAALMYAGTVWGDWMDWGDTYDWKVEYGQAICKILPEINFTDHKGNFVQAAKVNTAGE